MPSTTHFTHLKTDAIVLRKRMLPSQDALFSLFTRDQGKVVAYARGVKKVTSRRLAHLQTGNYIEVILQVRADQAYIAQTSLYSGFSQLKAAPMALDALYRGLFCIDRLIPEGQSEEALFDHALRMASQLSLPQATHQTLLYDFLETLLTKLGYRDQQTSKAYLYQTIEELTNEKLPVGII